MISERLALQAFLGFFSAYTAFLRRFGYYTATKPETPRLYDVLSKIAWAKNAIDD